MASEQRTEPFLYEENLYKGGKAATGAACYSGWGYIDLMRPALRDAGEEKWYHG